MLLDEDWTGRTLNKKRGVELDTYVGLLVENDTTGVQWDTYRQRQDETGH